MFAFDDISAQIQKQHMWQTNIITAWQARPLQLRGRPGRAAQTLALLNVSLNQPTLMTSATSSHVKDVPLWQHQRCLLRTNSAYARHICSARLPLRAIASDQGAQRMTVAARALAPHLLGVKSACSLHVHVIAKVHGKAQDIMWG